MEFVYEVQFFNQNGKYLCSIGANEIGDAEWVAMNMLGRASDDDQVGKAKILRDGEVLEETA